MSENQNQLFLPANPFDPDAWASGAPDNFTGIYLSGLIYPHKAKDKKEYYCFAGIRILPDPESGYEEFTEPYFVNNLNKAIPSKDNKTPAGGTIQDFMALAAGKGRVETIAESASDDTPCQDAKRHVLPNHPNTGPFVLGKLGEDLSYHQLVTALVDCDEKGLLNRDNGSLDEPTGLRIEWVRVPQSQGKGKKAKEPKEGEKTRKVLVPVRIIERVKLGSVQAQAASPASSSSASVPSSGAGDLATATTTAIKEYLSGKGPVLVGTIINDVANIVKKQGFKRAEVMAWIGERVPDPNNPDTKNRDIPVNLVDIDGTSFSIAAQTLELD